MAQVSRLEKKLDTCFENKEYYEAHQICRTLFYRLTASGKFDELLVLLEKGCLTLIQVEQFGSAYDLSEAFAETLLKSGVPVTEQRLIAIAKIVKGLPSQLDENIEAEKDRRVKFIAACVKWSQSVAVSPAHKARGSPALHGLFARVLYSEGAVDMARSHFMLSESPEEYATFLHDWFVRGEVEKTSDLWITLAVFQLICLRRVSFAVRVLSSYLSSSTPSLSPPYKTGDQPLAHFSWLLVRIVPTKNVHHYGAIIAKFQSSLGSDETIMPYLDQIGQLYFGVAPKGPGGGMFGNLLKGLMGGQQEEKKKLPSSDDERDAPTDPDAALFQSELALLLRGDAPPAVAPMDDDLD
ncbi:cee-1 [Pristionchus pacificus]|uniref:Cee-1 n=1 Tax=Pristionchus pacificus TaxID=54126 RepID=A0A2A6D089_PRIPA|nr:cee-1 [Pristionchus pacificus]|eukprot:PDM83825.1 cee-1 [Pristionchus pacificus]